MKTAQPIRSKAQIRKLAAYFLKQGEVRNHVLLVMGIHTALRISDLLRLTWDDVYDFEQKRVRESVSLIEKKTSKTKIVLLNESVASALKRYAHAAERGEMLFKSRNGENKAISRQQAHRIISGAAEALRFTSKVSCHSLRKTFGYFAWQAKVSPAIIMKIYNHSSIAVTERYLGITQDALNNCYRKLATIT